MNDAARTELTTIQERLRAVSNPLALLEGIFAFAPVGLQVYRVDGHSVLVNRAFRELFGSEPPPEYNVLRDDIAERGGFLPLIKRAFAGETIQFGPHWYDPRELEHVKVSEGRRVAVEVMMLPLLDDVGAVTHVAIIFKDATGELRAEELAVREQRAREATSLLLRVASHLTNATTPAEIANVILEHALVALGARRGVLALRGTEGGETVIAGDCAFGEEPRSSSTALLGSVIRTGEPVWGGKTESGKATVAAVPLATKRGTVGSLVFEFAPTNHYGDDERLLIDLLAKHAAQAIERAQLFQDAQEAARRAEAANRAKDEFLGIVSHELRTPLNAIHGWAHLIASSGRDDPSLVDRGIDVILRNAKAQVTIIDDILDTARIVVGKLRLTLVPTNLPAVVRAAIESVGPSAAAKNITLDLVVDGDPVVMGDPDRLQQVVWNLLTNAIKFTPPNGRVTLRAELEGSTARIRVSDDGIGIAADDLPLIFDRFRQVDSSTTRAKGGLGLGLAIVRHLVQAHGGSVDVTSDGPGHGSAFTIEIPAVSARVSTGRIRPARANLHGVNVLVVDDEPDSAELVALVLSRSGAQTRTANSVAQAWSLIEASVPDVLVSDIGMPGEDGFSLARRLRAANDARSQIPAIALTAYTRAEDAELSMQAGYGWHLKKPASAEQLLQAVAEAARR